ncbi:MAG: TauD/TfdA dioxygenase family protein [Acidimicrobiales bacterium]
MSVSTTPLTARIGAEIDGMAGSALVDPWVARECLALLNRYGVLVYRQAYISDADLVKFSRLLGDVVLNPTGEHEYREIATITLDPNKTDAVLASYRQGNFLWHIDGATDALPQKATLLTARAVDEEGGDTEFASTYAAYEALTESEKAEIAELCVLHSFSVAQRRAHPDASDAKQEHWRRVPTRVHPLVWTHRDGRKSLLLGATAAEVVGWSAERGTELLDRLLDWSTQSRFVLRHRWRRGDLVIWDNTGMLHRALPFEPTSRRLMHRTTLVGAEPVA